MNTLWNTSTRLQMYSQNVSTDVMKYECTQVV